MRFDQPADQSSQLRKDGKSEGAPVQPPRAPLKLRSTRSRPVIANRQIILMILSLMMVLYAMYEAGKPERWHWLIPPVPPTESENNLMLIQAPKQGSDVPYPPLEKLVEENLSEPQALSDPGLNQTDSDHLPQITENRSQDQVEAKDRNEVASEEGFGSDYPRGALEFWQALLKEFSARDRDDFYLILKRIRDGQPCPQLQQQTCEQLIDKISRARAQYHDQLFQKLTFASNDSKPALTNQWFESQQVWESLEQPALTAFVEAREISQPQRRQMGWLQTMLDKTFYDWVQDRTAQGWEGDSPAWGRIWEQVLLVQTGTAIPVTHLELSSQPSHYRGKQVEVKGWVRAARIETLTVKELDIAQMYVLVVRPEDSKVSPYFVYTTELPAGFPPLGDRFTTLNEGVSVRGYFFKIRTYLDTENKVQHSPMILTNQVQPWSPVGITASQTDAKDFLPKITLALLILPLLAAMLAWWLFRVTDIVRFRPGVGRTREIHHSLKELASNSDIKTPKERVDELYE